MRKLRRIFAIFFVAVTLLSVFGGVVSAAPVPVAAGVLRGTFTGADAFMTDGDNASIGIPNQTRTIDLNGTVNMTQIYLVGYQMTADLLNTSGTVIGSFYNGQNIGGCNISTGYCIQAVNGVRYVRITGNTASANMSEIDMKGTFTVLTPGTPTNVTATPGDRQITVNWDAMPRATTYNVYLNGTLNKTGLSTTSTTITGLTNGTSYSIKVSAVNAGGESPQSTAVSATPIPPPPPAVPTGLTATAGDSMVTLNWSPNTTDANFKGFFVYQDGVRITPSPITSTSYIIASGLTNGTAYSFSISAVNTSDVESARSSAVSATPLDKTPPAVPTGLTATAGYSKVDLSWSNVTDSDLAGFFVYQGTTKLTPTRITGTSYSVTGLTPGTSYSFTVSAVDTAGNESAKSSAASAVPLVPPDTTPPAVPNGLTATAGDSKVTLNWSPNTIDPDFRGFYVYQNGARITPTPITATSYIVAAGLTNGVSYSFTVSAVDTSGNESAKSPAASATPIDKTPPAVPTGLTATPGDSKIDLSFTAVTDSDLGGYFIYEGSMRLNSTPITTTSYSVSPRNNGTTYNFSVSAVDASGNESARSAFVAATPMAKPSSPTVQATTGDKTVTLNWAAVPSATSYKVYQDGVLIGTVTTTQYKVSGLSNGQTYTFAVVASNAALGDSDSGTIKAAPDMNVYSDSTAPEVKPAVQTAFSFLGLFGVWAYLVLGVIVAPALIMFLFYLIRKFRQREAKAEPAKHRRTRQHPAKTERRLRTDRGFEAIHRRTLETYAKQNPGFKLENTSGRRTKVEQEFVEKMRRQREAREVTEHLKQRSDRPARRGR